MDIENTHQGVGGVDFHLVEVAGGYGLAEVGFGFLEVLGHADGVIVAEPQAVEGVGIALVGGLGVPLDGLDRVGLDAEAFLVALA